MNNHIDLVGAATFVEKISRGNFKKKNGQAQDIKTSDIF